MRQRLNEKEQNRNRNCKSFGIQVLEELDGSATNSFLLQNYLNRMHRAKEREIAMEKGKKVMRKMTKSQRTPFQPVIWKTFQMLAAAAAAAATTLIYRSVRLTHCIC